jgi:hypothetical protein
MRLYVKQGNRKVYIDVKANSRHELIRKLGSNYFFINGKRYSITQVYADDSTNDTIGGAIVGGLFGAVVGPAGAMIGSVIGGALGNQKDRNDSIRVRKFNNSKHELR